MASADLNDRSDSDNDPMPNDSDSSNRYLLPTHCCDTVCDDGFSVSANCRSNEKWWFFSFLLSTEISKPIL